MTEMTTNQAVCSLISRNIQVADVNLEFVPYTNITAYT
jgi:hypothetical protein